MISESADSGVNPSSHISVNASSTLYFEAMDKAVSCDMVFDFFWIGFMCLRKELSSGSMRHPGTSVRETALQCQFMGLQLSTGACRRHETL